jgi:hypothetical protein
MPSNVILAMHYEPHQRELVVVFRGRGAYRYFDVPLEEWVAFRAAESKGTYLNEIFKSRGHRYERGPEAARQSSNDSSNSEDATLTWGEAGALRKPITGPRAWREREATSG